MSGDRCPICARPAWADDIIGPCDHSAEEWAKHTRDAFRRILAEYWPEPPAPSPPNE